MKVGVLGEKWLFFGEIVVFRHKFLYSGNLVVYGKSGCNGAKGLYSVKVVVNGQKCCIRAKWLYSGKSCYIRTKGVVLVQIVVFRQTWL